MNEEQGDTAMTPSDAIASTRRRPSITAGEDDRHLLLRIVEEAYRQNTFNGTNLQSSLQSVSAEQAAWRPPHARHSIAEIAVHSAYWKFATRTRMNGQLDAAFPLEGEDWFDVDASLDDEAWKGLLSVLDEEHAQFCRAIRRSERDLAFNSRAGRELVRKIFGVAMHDAYHTGQIHLIQAQYRRAHPGATEP
jgi:hypothetical protein